MNHKYTMFLLEVYLHFLEKNIVKPNESLFGKISSCLNQEFGKCDIRVNGAQRVPQPAPNPLASLLCASVWEVVTFQVSVLFPNKAYAPEGRGRRLHVYIRILSVTCTEKLAQKYNFFSCESLRPAPDL